MLQVLQHSFDRTMKCIEGVPYYSQDLVFVDPPYNLGIPYAEDPTSDRLPLQDYQHFCEMTLRSLRRYILPGATLWWLCPSGHSDWIGWLLTSIIGPRKYLIVKEETFSQYQQKTLTDDFRLLYCHQAEGGDFTFNPDSIRIPSDRQSKYNDPRADPRGRVPGRVWKVRRLQGTSQDHVDWHPAQLPPELLGRIVNGWSNPGDKVLDAFAGSGNLGLICRTSERDFTGLDQSPTYITKMKERLGI